MIKVLQLFCAVILLFSSPLYADSPHDEAGIRCLDCHEVLPFQGVPLSFYGDIKQVCSRCHNDYPCKKPEEGKGYSHPLAVVPRMVVPDDMVLDRKGRLSCVTCHFFHDQGMAGYVRNPFYLRRSSIKRLCASCHGEI